MSGDQRLVGLTDELHRRLHVQARNLLLEYRLAAGPHRGCVPHEVVEKLMKLYGNLIAREIFAAMAVPTVAGEIEIDDLLAEAAE